MANQMWSKGLFGCFSDTGLCIVTFLVPCYTAGKNAEQFEGESCFVHGITLFIPVLGTYFHSLIRGKIREKQRIDGTFLNDLILTCFCPWCTLIQEAQELEPPALLSMARE